MKKRGRPLPKINGLSPSTFGRPTYLPEPKFTEEDNKYDRFGCPEGAPKFQEYSHDPNLLTLAAVMQKKATNIVARMLAHQQSHLALKKVNKQNFIRIFNDN